MSASLLEKCGSSKILFLVLALFSWWPDSAAAADELVSSRPEFSATVVKTVNGKQQQARVFAKWDRLRLEYKYALRTDLGYTSIEIIRLDQAETWYVLAQRREMLVVPLDPDDAIPIRPELAGESSRALVGDSRVANRPASLFEVETNRRGRGERFYEWVDEESGVVLKLMSRDRDWMFEYERFRLSPQPDYYFEIPSGYQRRVVSTGLQRKG